MGDYKEAMSSRHNRTDTHMNSEIMAAYTDLHRFKLNKFPALRGGCGHGVTPLTKKLFTIGTQ